MIKSRRRKSPLKGNERDASRDERSYLYLRGSLATTSLVPLDAISDTRESCFEELISFVSCERERESSLGADGGVDLAEISQGDSPSTGCF